MELSYDGKILLNVKNKDINPDGSITLPEGITEIVDYAFKECKNLTHITLP